MVAHVAHRQLGAGEISSVAAPECRDRRYFVLDGAGRLAWWKHEEEETLRMPPQVGGCERGGRVVGARPPKPGFSPSPRPPHPAARSPAAPTVAT